MVIIVSNNFQGSIVFSLSLVIQNTAGQAPRCHADIPGDLEAVHGSDTTASVLGLSSVPGSYRWPRCYFCLSSQSRWRAPRFTLYLLQCTRLDKDKQTSLLRLSIFLVFIDTYLIFFYCTARCSK